MFEELEYELTMMPRLGILLMAIGFIILITAELFGLPAGIWVTAKICVVVGMLQAMIGALGHSCFGVRRD
jgi:hypothetical protein